MICFNLLIEFDLIIGYNILGEIESKNVLL